MEKIKLRITKAVENMQLAENEMDRMSILKKPVSLDSDCKSMLQLMERISKKMQAQSAP
jgi:hypothetical protein